MSKSKSELEVWQARLAEEPGSEAVVVTVPLHVLLGEAADVARFFQKYWKDQKEGGSVRRGLESAAAKGKLGSKTGDEILSLREAVSQAQSKVQLAMDPKGPAAPMARAHFLLGELTATLEWLFDDGVEDEKDAQLAKVAADHADDPESFDAMASALDDYAALAGMYRKEMDGLGGFDAGNIDEARRVAAELRDRPAVAAGPSEAAKAALGVRKGLVGMLARRMGTVRAAARFVFRGKPEIVREVTSVYERRRRAAARRGKEKKVEAAGQGPAGGAVEKGAGVPAAMGAVTTGKLAVTGK